MEKLTNNELKQIYGGWSITSVFGIGTLFTFLIGIIDGYIRPLNCR